MEFEKKQEEEVWESTEGESGCARIHAEVRGRRLRQGVARGF